MEVEGGVGMECWIGCMVGVRVVRGSGRLEWGCGWGRGGVMGFGIVAVVVVGGEERSDGLSGSNNNYCDRRRKVWPSDNTVTWIVPAS